MGERAMFDLRMDPAHAHLLAGHIDLPTTPNTSARRGTLEALWLGPDGWLLIDEGGPSTRIPVSLGDQLQGVHYSLIDVSANRVVIDLGTDGREVLAAGCTLDLHPSRWSTGACAQTLVAKVPVMLHERTDGTRVYVRPSFEAWLRGWFEAVGGEPV